MRPGIHTLVGEVISWWCVFRLWTDVCRVLNAAVIRPSHSTMSLLIQCTYSSTSFITFVLSAPARILSYITDQRHRHCVLCSITVQTGGWSGLLL